MGKCRRTGVAALVLLSLSLGATGCLSSRRSGGYHTPASSSGCARCPTTGAVLGTPSGPGTMGMPGGPGIPGVLPPGAMRHGKAGGDILRTTYFQDENGNLIPKDGEPQPYVGGPAHPVVGSASPGPLPRELVMSSHPPYTVAPPDILVIESFRLIPKPPYRIDVLEGLLVNVSDTLPGQPISGLFVVAPDGTINLGFTYGSVRVAGMSLEQAQQSIKTHLSPVLKLPTVSVALAQARGLQNVRGQYLIRPDGTIGLGVYGAVYVAGMTLGQVKCVIEKHLSEYMLDPQVSVDVLAYNSKFYYIVMDGAGQGQQVVRIPITGNETVLDAISIINGLSPVSSKRRIWLARPSPVHHGCNQILPIDWRAITEAASTATNYQIFPGDRIFVDSDWFYRFDTNLAKVLSPIERIMGTTLLGTSVIQSFQSIGNGGSGTGVLFVP